MTRAQKSAMALLKRFTRAERGATAVEFALIALPFLVMLFGIIELGVVFMVSVTLQNGTDYAARSLRTGRFQTSGATTKADFKTLVCKNMSWLATSCATNLTVDVQTFTNFNALNATGAVNPTTFNPAATCWSSGQPGDIVLVRTFFKWRIFTPLLSAALVNMGSGSENRLISSATSFRNEPWSSQTPVGAAC